MLYRPNVLLRSLITCPTLSLRGLNRLSSIQLPQQSIRMYHSSNHENITSHLDKNCLFCKIIQGQIPSEKLVETETCYSFLDIGPLSQGHSLIIPKYHGEKLHDIPDKYLSDMLPLAKKIALAIGAKEYNILQNNGKGAHQAIDHVHVHVIPKINLTTGLQIEWNDSNPSKDELSKIANQIRKKLN